MSEYQYYEFQAIDRPLTEEKQKAVSQLSSRVDPHPRQAVFVYNYSDFPGDPEQVLARYYDAMFYIANWGSTQLMFRFPQSLIDLEQVQAYCYPDYAEECVSFSTVGKYVILNIEFHDEEGDGWIEGEGWLPALLPLRDDILRGDYRVLYLAWLRALEMEDVLDSVAEPPVPPGLNRMSPALCKFVELFEIDPLLIQVAAEASQAQEAVADDWLHPAISQLSREESDIFLLRLARGESHLSLEFKKRLREIASASRPGQSAQSLPEPRRTAGQVLREVEERQEHERQRQAAEAEAKRIQELETLAWREDQVWAEVDALIQQKESKSYDEAAQLLLKLHDLSGYQGQETAFQQRLNRIYEQYSRRNALLHRLHNADLHQVL